MSDLWTGRKKGRKCSTCMYWVEKEPTTVKKSHTVIGRCRRNAPIVEIGYPTTYPDDWCGQYKMDEEKI